MHLKVQTGLFFSSACQIKDILDENQRNAWQIGRSVELGPSGRPVADQGGGKGRVIDSYQYLLLMGACLLITLPLEFVLGARVYRRPGALWRALLPVVVVFSVWDVAGILAGHWTYNPRYVTGVQLVLGMPLEELVFFLVVPICGLLTYEAVGVILRRFARPAALRRGGEVSDA